MQLTPSPLFPVNWPWPLCEALVLFYLAAISLVSALAAPIRLFAAPPGGRLRGRGHYQHGGYEEKSCRRPGGVPSVLLHADDFLALPLRSTGNPLDVAFLLRVTFMSFPLFSYTFLHPRVVLVCAGDSTQVQETDRVAPKLRL